MVFSDASLGQGILQQARSLARVDSVMWPTAKVVASCNNYLDTLTGFLIASDKRFQWDDTNHTALPEGTTDLVLNQSDYSFLTDQQGNTILTLTGITLVTSAGVETRLELTDRNSENYDKANYGVTTGIPTQYDKIADNIIRLNYKPNATAVAGYDLKFYFQRTPSYFAATDTTKAPGVAPILHRGFVIAAAYDCALTLGLANLNNLALEMQREEIKRDNYFKGRDNDERSQLVANVESMK